MKISKKRSLTHRSVYGRIMPIPIKHKLEKRQSAKMRVFCTLREWIIYGTLKPGERLVDQEISDYFEVSRTPVREAIQMLEAQKLVVVFPNKGTEVSEIDVSNLGKWYLPLAHLHALAAELACRTITSEQLNELRKIDSKIGIYVKQGDLTNTLREDLQFHNMILSLVNNEFIIEFSNTLITHIQRFEYSFFSQAGYSVKNFNPHDQLLGYLEKRDEKGAYNEMMENWLLNMNRYEKLLADQGISQQNNKQE